MTPVGPECWTVFFQCSSPVFPCGELEFSSFSPSPSGIGELTSWPRNCIVIKLFRHKIAEFWHNSIGELKHLCSWVVDIVIIPFRMLISGAFENSCLWDRFQSLSRQTAIYEGKSVFSQKNCVLLLHLVDLIWPTNCKTAKSKQKIESTWAYLKLKLFLQLQLVQPFWAGQKIQQAGIAKCAKQLISGTFFT